MVANWFLLPILNYTGKTNIQVNTFLLTDYRIWNSLGGKLYKTNSNMLRESTTNRILVIWNQVINKAYFRHSCIKWLKNELTGLLSTSLRSIFTQHCCHSQVI